MPNLVAYNSGSVIPNSIQFGTIVMDVNGDVAQGSLLWCPDFGICNQYLIVTDSYTNGKTNQLSARAMGFQTSGLTDVALIQGINRLALSKSSGPFVTLSDAINWAIYEGYFITNQEYPAIVTSGCVLNLDSNFPPSYPLVFNTWYDLTGNGNTGLLNNGITYNSALRGSLTLNGTNQYVSFSATTSIPVANSNYTISTWFNPSTLSGDRGLIGWGNYGTTNQVNALKITSSGLVNYWGANDLSVNYSFTLGDWYNAVANFDGTTRSIWVNGVLIGSDTPTGHNVPFSTNLTVGLTNVTEFFGGGMGEVQIFNRALNSTEISDNYNALLPRYNGTYTDPCDIAPQCTPTSGPSVTATPTSTNTPTPSVTIGLTPTATETQTQTPTNTPTPTYTQTPTPTLLPPIFILNPPQDGGGPDACQSYNNLNRASYYASISNGNTIQSGTSLYTDETQVGNPSYYIQDGYYSNGVLYWYFQGGSTSDNGTSCTVPTNTPTQTITQTPTQSFGISPTPTRTQTSTPTATPSQTPSIGSSPTPTETPTQTPTSTQTGTPTQTPTITPMPTGTPFPTLPFYQRECTVVAPVCRAADPAFVNIYERNYDGYSNILNWLNIANPQNNYPYNVNSEIVIKKIYDLLGRDITIYNTSGNVELNLSYYGLVGGNDYFVQYDVYCKACDCNSVQVLSDEVGRFRLYNLGIGNATSSPVNYSSTNISGQDACYPFNESLFIYYDIAQTNVSLGAPLFIGSTIYLNSARTTTAPAGAYVMRNNNKYIVNSSGVVTSIETNVCTVPPTFSLKFKKDTFTWKAGFSVCNFIVGDSYIIYNVNCSSSQLRGTIQSKSGTGANQILTLTNWTSYCG
jgi:hypothetical protein